MYNTNIPNDRELPSTVKLVKSTIFAAAIAFILLVTVVMPAEYGIDPTGVGKVTGLQKMGEIKMSLAQEAKIEKMSAEQVTQAIATAQPLSQVAPVQNATPAAAKVIAPASAARRDEMKVTLAPNEGTEIKVTLEKGKSVNYVWWTDGGKANFDIHADSKELNIDYHGYGKGSEQRKEGVIVAAFDGHHGWFWRNRTPETITVTLQASGEYTDIQRMK
jgi:hypothetical protein